jgi:hypothetical protein
MDVFVINLDEGAFAEELDIALQSGRRCLLLLLCDARKEVLQRARNDATQLAATQRMHVFRVVRGPLHGERLAGSRLATRERQPWPLLCKNGPVVSLQAVFRDGLCNALKHLMLLRVLIANKIVTEGLWLGCTGSQRRQCGCSVESNGIGRRSGEAGDLAGKRQRRLIA